LRVGTDRFIDHWLDACWTALRGPETLDGLGQQYRRPVVLDVQLAQA
jgi:hypothetical protein